MDEKRFRFDLLIALLALAISAVAAGASAYQTYVIRKQFSATVWPYLTFVTSSSSGKYFQLDVSNVGIGPALVYDAVVTRDGKVVERPTGPASQPAIGAAFDPERRAAKAAESKSGARGVEGKFLAPRVLADIGRVNVSLCYCSVLGDCWTKRLQDPAVRPRAARACTSA